MDFRELLEDLSTLEVATLTTHLHEESLKIEKEPESPAANSVLPIVKGRFEKRQAELLALLKAENPERQAVRKAKQNLRKAERELDETRKAMGIYDPRDLFSKIRAALPGANLVAYSRFELEGDSINFINNNAQVQGLVGMHHFMVSASQEARRALFDAALRSDRLEK